jgi:excisionase family DNA binding protein
MTTTKTDIEPMVFDLGSVARALGGLGLSTVRAMVASGELKSIKIRDRRFVRREHLIEYLDKHVAA